MQSTYFSQWKVCCLDLISKIQTRQFQTPLSDSLSSFYQLLQDQLQLSLQDVYSDNQTNEDPQLFQISLKRSLDYLSFPLFLILNQNFEKPNSVSIHSLELVFTILEFLLQQHLSSPLSIQQHLKFLSIFHSAFLQYFFYSHSSTLITSMEELRSTILHCFCAWLSIPQIENVASATEHFGQSIALFTSKCLECASQETSKTLCQLSLSTLYKLFITFPLYDQLWSKFFPGIVSQLYTCVRQDVKRRETVVEQALQCFTWLVVFVCKDEHYQVLLQQEQLAPKLSFVEIQQQMNETSVKKGEEILPKEETKMVQQLRYYFVPLCEKVLDAIWFYELPVTCQQIIHQFALEITSQCKDTLVPLQSKLVYLLWISSFVLDTMIDLPSELTFIMESQVIQLIQDTNQFASFLELQKTCHLIALQQAVPFVSKSVFMVQQLDSFFEHLFPLLSQQQSFQFEFLTSEKQEECLRNCFGNIGQYCDAEQWYWICCDVIFSTDVNQKFQQQAVFALLWCIEGYCKHHLITNPMLGMLTSVLQQIWNHSHLLSLVNQNQSLLLGLLQLTTELVTVIPTNVIQPLLSDGFLFWIALQYFSHTSQRISQECEIILKSICNIHFVNCQPDNISQLLLETSDWMVDIFVKRFKHLLVYPQLPQIMITYFELLLAQKTPSSKGVMQVMEEVSDSIFKAMDWYALHCKSDKLRIPKLMQFLSILKSIVLLANRIKESRQPKIVEVSETKDVVDEYLQFDSDEESKPQKLSHEQLSSYFEKHHKQEQPKIEEKEEEEVPTISPEIQQEKSLVKQILQICMNFISLDNITIQITIMDILSQALHYFYSSNSLLKTNLKSDDYLRKEYEREKATVDEQVFPLIHKLWPHLIMRMKQLPWETSSKVYMIQLKTITLVQQLCTHFGHFMYPKIVNDFWPLVQKLWKRLDKLEYIKLVVEKKIKNQQQYKGDVFQYARTTSEFKLHLSILKLLTQLANSNEEDLSIEEVPIFYNESIQKDYLSQLQETQKRIPQSMNSIANRISKYAKQKSLNAYDMALQAIVYLDWRQPLELQLQAKLFLQNLIQIDSDSIWYLFMEFLFAQPAIIEWELSSLKPLEYYTKFFTSIPKESKAQWHPIEMIPVDSNRILEDGVLEDTKLKSVAWNKYSQIHNHLHMGQHFEDLLQMLL